MSDIITLESDEEFAAQDEMGEGREGPEMNSMENGGANQAGTATASIVNEKPLNMQSLFGNASHHESLLPHQPMSNRTGGVHNANSLPTTSQLSQIFSRSNSNGGAANRSLHNLANIARSSGSSNGSAGNDGMLNKNPMHVFNNGHQHNHMGNGHYGNKNGVHQHSYGDSSNDSSGVPAKRARLTNQLNGFNNNQARPKSSFTSHGGTSIKIKQLSETYIEAYGATQSSFNDDEFAGQFKCTYNGCRKRLRNNVTFMYHLWAHVNRQKPPSGHEDDLTNLQLTSSTFEESPAEQIKDDVTRLRTCPECLLVQPSPHRMHLHYHRVHKFDKLLASQDLAICNICESVYHFKNMTAHLQRHGDLDLPYQCKKCRYRTSAREALFRHFLESHCGTSMLICPFCLLSFNVPLTERQRPTVVMKAYVQHIMDHDLESQHGCDQCVTRFRKCGVTSLSSRIENHSKQHKEVDPKWKVTRKNIVNLQRQPHSKAISSSADLPQKCLECNHVTGDGKQQQQHFKELKKCRAKQCAYETCCSHAMELHTILSVCWSENKKRWPLGKPTQTRHSPSSPTPGPQLQCSKCGFETSDGNSMTRHLATNKRCLGGKAKVKSVEMDQKLGWESEQLQAVEYFGLDRMKDIDPVKLEQEKEEGEEEDAIMVEEPVEEEFKKLSEILPISKINVVRENRVMLKHLLRTNTAAEQRALKELVFVCHMDDGKMEEEIKEHLRLLHQD